MLRVSNYNIYLPIDFKNKEFMLVQGYTGAIDVLTEDIYFQLKNAESDCGIIDNFNEDIKDVLISRGYITNKSESEELELFKAIANSIQQFQSKCLSLVIIPTYNCNFRCSYCFEKTLLNNGNDWLNKTMSSQMVEKIFEYARGLIAEGKLINNICLYGGEPLLKENISIIKRIIELTKEMGLEISAVTNGYDLDFYKEYLGKNGISKLQITLDGIETTHNERRYLVGHKPSFYRISGNIDMCLELGVQVAVRTNLDKDNFNEIDQLINYFDMNGWTSNLNFSHYFKGVRSCKINDNQEINDSSIIDTIKGKKMNRNTYSYNTCYDMLYKMFKHLFENKGFAPLRTSFCGSALNMVVIDPFGEIYPCWEVVGNKQHIVGKMNIETGISYNGNSTYWGNRVVQNIDECSVCPYAMFCGGGCAAMAKDKNGSIYTSHCEEFKKAFNEVVPVVYKNFIQA